MSQMHLVHDARASGGPKRTDLLDLLSSGEPPAFANDQNHRIVFWNKGAERVMERTAAQALGRLCHEVFKGKDQFGNAFCAEVCAVSSQIRRHEPVNRFEIAVGHRPRDSAIGMTILEIPDSRPGYFMAVHILDQVDTKSRLARELARLVDQNPRPEPAQDGSVPITLRKRASPKVEAAVVDASVTAVLSDRELEVLRAIAAGQSNKDIARTLHISVATTRNHVQHILKKLNVHSKLEALALGFRNGWS